MKALTLEEWVRLLEDTAQGLSRKALRVDDVLSGPGAGIDSLNLLVFLVRLEQKLLEKTGTHVPVLEEKNLQRILKEGVRVRDLITILSSAAEGK